MKVKTVTIFSVILILIIALTFTAFARGRGSNLMKIQLDNNAYKKIEATIDNLYNSIKNLVNKEVSAGIITSYYADSIIKNIDSAYSQIKKTKIIYLPFFGVFGPRGPKGQMQMPGQGPQNQAGQPTNTPYGPMGFGQNQFSQQQIETFKTLIPEVTKVMDAELAFGKALKDAGIITDLQLTAYTSRIEQIKKYINQVPLIHYGIMQFFMLAGYNPNN